jgi:hypothetical protein
MDLAQFINGSSSLLFLVSTGKAFHASNLITWKASNVALVVTSFLCNAYGFEKTLLLLDYLTIYIISASYIQTFYINIPYTVVLVYEWKMYGQIENTKNLAFATAITMSIVNTYLHVSKTYFYLLVISFIGGSLIYKIRYSLYNRNKNQNILWMTYIFHVCMTTILYISSITAV